MSWALRPGPAALVERLFPGSSVQPVASDASTRRFYRIIPVGGVSWILMDYGAPFDGETDDVRLARLFQEAGLPVARVEHVRPEEGCLVLEDLGSRTLESTLAALEPGDTVARERLYQQAVSLAVAIATRGTASLGRSNRASSPALDSERLRFEMDFFLEHYAAGLAGVRAAPAGLVAALHDLAERAADCAHPVLCHRDFHSRNLMVRDDESLALVDIQDARRGPLGYDLVSLVYDAYASLDDDLSSSLIESFRDTLPGAPPRDVFEAGLVVVAAQRLIKALGTFGYQATVLGRRRYLEGVPRTLERLARLLPRSPETAPVAEGLLSVGLLDFRP
ncbi:MAG: phosphotransferase [Acidobacteriia bacterium]|nr:phosphotransferase [Terriglobia bacterium]